MVYLQDQLEQGLLAPSKPKRLDPEVFGHTNLQQTFNSAAIELIPGYANYLQSSADGESLLSSWAKPKEGFSPDNPEYRSLYENVPRGVAEEMRDSSNESQLLATKKRYEMSIAGSEFLESKYGAAKYAIYAPVGLMDPMNLGLYGIAGKIKAINNIYKAGSATKKVMTTGLVAGTIEATEDAIVRHETDKHYESVPFTFGLAFGLGAGGQFLANSLHGKAEGRAKEIVNELNEKEITLEANPIEFKKLADEFDLATVSPIRSRLYKMLHAVTPKVIESPLTQAYNKGGAISWLAQHFDLMPGRSTVQKEGLNAMDLKYESFQDFITYNRGMKKAIEESRKALNGKRLSPEEEAKLLVDIEVAHLNQRKAYIEAKINTRIEVRGENLEEITKRFEAERDSLIEAKRQEVIESRKLKGKDAKETKLGTDEIKAIDDSIQSKIDLEIERLTIEKLRANEDIANLNKGDSPVNIGVQAKLDYGNSIGSRMIDTGLDKWKNLDPMYYSPTLHNKEKIMLEPEKAIEAYRESIKTSPEYIQKMKEAEENLGIAKQDKSAKEVAQARKEIAKLEEEMFELASTLKGMQDLAMGKTVDIDRINDVLAMTEKGLPGGLFGRPPSDKETILDEMLSTHQPKEVVEQLMSVYNLEDLDKLWRLGGKPKIAIESPAGPSALAHYSLDRHTISIHFPKKMTKHHMEVGSDTLLHELIHAMTSRQIHKGTDFGKRLSSLYDEVINNKDIVKAIEEKMGAQKNRIYGIKNAHEFYTEMLSRPDFAKALNEIPTPSHLLSGTEPKSLLVTIIEKIMELSGLSIRKGDMKVQPASLLAEGLTRVESGMAKKYTRQKIKHSEGFKNLSKVQAKVKKAHEDYYSYGKKHEGIREYLEVESYLKRERIKLKEAIAKKEDASELKGNIKAWEDLLSTKTKPDGRVVNALKRKKAKVMEASAELDKLLHIRRQGPDYVDTATNKLKERISELEEKIEFLSSSNKMRKDTADYIWKKKEYDRLVGEVSRLKALDDGTKKSGADIAIAVNKMKSAKKKKLELEKNMTTKDIKHVEDYLYYRSYPWKASKRFVNNFLKQKEDFANLSFRHKDFSDDHTPSRFKRRTLMVDTANPKMQPYLRLGDPKTMDGYHYQTSGRIALAKSVGTYNWEDYVKMNHQHFTEKGDKDILEDLFTSVLGTKQLPANVDAWSEKFFRNMSYYNYTTMGGQFAKYGVGEIAAGIYSTGFRYLKELVPAIGEVKDMYKGQELSKIANDSMVLAEATSIFENMRKSRMDDATHFETTYSRQTSSFEGFMAGMSKAMFRYSGLEGITTITQMALPRAFMRRLLSEDISTLYKDSPDLIRYGLTQEDLMLLHKQPIKVNKEGAIVDFNFENWTSPELTQRVKTATTRMARETIIRPDATRLPGWMVDGSIGVLMKLGRQFMGFTFVAHERLLMRGMNERQASAAIAAMTSTGILLTLDLMMDESAYALGITDERKDDITTEEGLHKRLKQSFLRNSFAGHIGGIIDQIDSMAQYGQEGPANKMLGGPTYNRASSYLRSANDMLDGKYGTKTQAHSLKITVPFSNMLGADEFSKAMSQEAVGYEK